MNKSLLLMILIFSALLTGCASNKSIVTSERSTIDKVEEGVVYSLPKQLVKVDYTRKAIDSTKAADAMKKAKEAVDVTNKALNGV
jgi:hypothetical protein